MNGRPTQYIYIHNIVHVLKTVEHIHLMHIKYATTISNREEKTLETYNMKTKLCSRHFCNAEIKTLLK